MTDVTGRRPLTAADLHRFPLTAPLDDDLRAMLAGRLRTYRVRKGHLIFTEGEVGNVVYLLIDGKVKVTRTPPDGREALLAVMGPGDVFGELAVFDPGPRTATATSLSICELASISSDDLNDAISARPEVGATLLRVLARRLRTTDDALADLIFTDVPGRVAGALLGLAERFGRTEPSGAIRVEHGLTQEELAQLVGAARETVNKTLSDFANRGWVRLDSKIVTILDADRLRARAH
jgi:CRP/FNR family transcriptional regulator